MMSKNLEINPITKMVDGVKSYSEVNVANNLLEIAAKLVPALLNKLPNGLTGSDAKYCGGPTYSGPNRDC